MLGKFIQIINGWGGEMSGQRMNRYPLTALSLLLLMVLGGCAQPVRDEVIDEPWPELDEQAPECTDISGRYRSRPRIHGKGEQLDTPLLAYTLLPASPKLAEADRVELKVTETKMSITAFAGELPLMSHTYPVESGIFECIAGSVEFRPQKKPGSDAAATLPGLEWETVRIRRTVDGSLLLQEADGLASLAFILFPIYFTTEHWYLFKPVE